MVLAQEHRVPVNRIAQATSRLAQLGWHAVCAPAVVENEASLHAVSTSGTLGVTSASGGVAILVRNCFGLRNVSLPLDGDYYDAANGIIDPGRAVVAIADLPGTHGIVLYS